MGNIIASSYEIIREIGSGGGGVVYLGRHLRLNKQIVLKAYKRTGASKPAALSREVDALKNLSHTYIPQVYDYVEENGTIYSVMDYIEGESLDRPLKRGEHFTQPQVIAWACQLLDALCYLHSRPPYGILHSDIKPANIMLTPQGDIRLIDFNIALALGEEGAVRVGFSRGYASPEHYGIAYLPPSAQDAKTDVSGPDTELPTDAATQFGPETQLPTGPDTRLSRGSSTSAGAALLDVRSDVYSLGATLYHLLTGRRPAVNAGQTPAIQPQEASPAVAAIIEKAMSPNPEDRYQTAAEMLQAFQRLHETDPRVLRLRAVTRTAMVTLAALFLCGTLCTVIGLKQMERIQEQAKVAAETSEKALALTTDSEVAYRAGDVPEAVRLAMESLELSRTARAQRALTDALGVYNLSDAFRPSQSLTLPSAPLKAALSPDGARAAALVSGKVLAFDTETGETLAELPAETSALADVVFLGKDAILYAGDGALRAYDLAAGQELWSGKAATGIAVSADSSTAAAVYKDENLAAVYDARTGEALKAVSFQDKHQSVLDNDIFADPEDNLFAISADGRWLAASFSDGGLRLFYLPDGAGDLQLFETSAYRHFEGGFSGQYFAFSASNEDESVFSVIDLEAREQTGGFSSPNAFHVHADEAGILVATENLLVQLDPVTGSQQELAYAEADITAFSRSGGYTLTALSNGTAAFFDEQANLLNLQETPIDFAALAGEAALLADRNTPSLRLLRLETHQEAQIMTYDPAEAHDEARLREDGGFMLYRYDGFQLYNPDGAPGSFVELPNPGEVYDQQYRRDPEGDYLEVIYNDGTVRRYAASDGSLLSETAETPPDRTLDVEFFTDRLRIATHLHGAAAAYDRETGALVRELEKDDYLAYATQIGEYVVTEYVTAQGERYGLLLDENCETLARLPGLCDLLADGTLVFDDMRGNLRKSHLYSLEELMALAGPAETEDLAAANR